MIILSISIFKLQGSILIWLVGGIFQTLNLELFKQLMFIEHFTESLLLEK